MSKHWNPGKKTVELHSSARPSRIRREPVQPSRIRRDPVRDEKEMFWRTREWEIRLSVAGIVMFALALTIIVIGFGDILWK